MVAPGLREGIPIFGCCAVVRGSTIRGTAVLPIASGSTRSFGAALLGFGLFAVPRGLCSPLPFCPLALYSLFSYTRAKRDQNFLGYCQMDDLPVIQKTYDLIKWYVPILNRLPREHKFLLGDRIVNRLYDLLEGLIQARYAQDKLPQLQVLNDQLDILRHQTRLLLDFNLIGANRYEYAGQLLNDIGTDLGGWIKHQRKRVMA